MEGEVILCSYCYYWRNKIVGNFNFLYHSTWNVSSMLLLLYVSATEEKNKQKANRKRER